MIRPKLIFLCVALVFLVSFIYGQQSVSGPREPSFAGSPPPPQGSPPAPDPKGTTPPEEPEPRPSGTHLQIETAPRPIGIGSMVLMGILLAAAVIIALTSRWSLFSGERLEEE